MGKPRDKFKCKYSGLSVPIGLVKEVRAKIKDDWRYSSVTDYVKHAVKEKLDRDKNLEDCEHGKT